MERRTEENDNNAMTFMIENVSSLIAFSIDPIKHLLLASNLGKLNFR